VVEEETSNGFHVFELHMPTMGANVVLIIIVILAEDKAVETPRTFSFSMDEA
jgi:hypothetical protein